MKDFNEPVEKLATDQEAKGLARQSPAWKRMLLADLILVLVFGFLGMRSHHEEVEILLFIRIASPFILAFAAAVAVTQFWRTAHRLWPQGVILWFITVAGGIGLRLVFGDGIAIPFQLVTAGVLAAFLLGRRLITSFIFRSGN